MWDGGDVGAGGERRERPRAKVIAVGVVTVVMLLTLVLCCVAIGKAASLIDVDTDHLPWAPLP